MTASPTLTLGPLVELSPAPLAPVAFDLYRDVHKGIRSELFALTESAGRIDPTNPLDVAALSANVAAVSQLLDSHAEHEDAAIGPRIEIVSPAIADRIAVDHDRLDGRIGQVLDLAVEATTAATAERRGLVHRLYVDLGSFTSAYLAHQDLEERLVMPALEQALGVPEMLAIHGEILSTIPPESMARFLAVMLPAMNIDDRTEMLGGMRAEAPPEVFAGVWSIARSVLQAADVTALSARLGGVEA